MIILLTIFLMRFMMHIPSRWIIFVLVVLFTFAGSSCSTRNKMGSCKENSTYRNYNPKKNKSRYSQRYSYKNRSVRKNYVIKNGIAH